MKNFTKILLLIISCYTIGYSQVQIGNGTSETQSIPMEPYYGYSYSQSIYLQSEVSATGSITSIQYFYSGTSDLSSSDDNIQIWIGHTTKSEFTSTTDWEPNSGMTQVFNGSIPAPTTPGTDEWLTITLDTPFPYNNTDNLIIAVDANEDGYNSSGDDFHCTSVGTSRSIYYRSDSTNPDPTSPPAANGTINYIPNTILGGLTAVASAPSCANLSEPDNDSNIALTCGTLSTNVNVSWTAPNSTSVADSYDVYLGTTSGSLTLHGNTTQLNYSFNTLTAGTYFWQVIAKNATGSATGCQERSFIIADGDSGSGDQSFTFGNSYASGGPTYSWIDPVASNHTEITTMTTGTDDDGYFHVTDMGITFKYFPDSSYTECYIGTNGYVSFTSGYTSYASSTTIPSTGGPNNMIAGCMMDLDDNVDGQIFYGSSNGNFVITWFKYHDYGSNDEWISFQIILEGDDDGGFTIQYNETESSANIDEVLSDAVIGAEFGDSEGVVYRSDGIGGPVFCSPLAVGFSSSALLPIDLLSFEGKAMKDHNMLTWITSMEENTEWHIIERSIDGKNNWEEIGKINARGFSENNVSYQLMDFAPLAKGFYRLKSVDYDGYNETSDMIMVRRKSIDKEIRVFPNPTNGLTNIEFTTDFTNQIDIHITDISGKTISTSTFVAQQGVNAQAIDMSKLSKGIYFISIFNGTENITQKVIKL